MGTLAKLVVKLIADVSDFSSGMDGAAKKVGKVSDDLLKAGGTMTAAVTVPLVALGTAAVNAASDLEETRNKTKTVFGDMSDSIFEMGQTASSSLGMSQEQALAFASTYGSLLKGAGLNEQEVSSMSGKLVQLTADFASFHNLAPEDAFEKIKAGIVGSSEPLLSIGKNLQQTQVDAYAAANGIGFVGQELSQGELMMARYGLLLQQSGDETGDFARTSDGLANSTRIAQATLQDVSATMGQELLPVALEFMQALIPILQGFNNMDPAAKKTIISLLGVLAAAGPVMTGIGGVGKVVSMLIKLFGTGGGLAGVGTFLSGTALPALGGAITAVGLPVIALIAAVGALIFVIVKFGDDALNTLKMVWEIGGAYLRKFADWLSGVFTGAIEGISNAIRSVVDWFGRLKEKITSIHLPSWLTPGSPTPLEMGLRGINKELKRTAANAMPSFSASINATAKDPLSESSDSSSAQMVALLSQLTQRRELDEFTLSRAIRDAFVQVNG